MCTCQGCSLSATGTRRLQCASAHAGVLSLHCRKAPAPMHVSKASRKFPPGPRRGLGGALPRPRHRRRPRRRHARLRGGAAHRIVVGAEGRTREAWEWDRFKEILAPTRRFGAEISRRRGPVRDGDLGAAAPRSSVRDGDLGAPPPEREGRTLEAARTGERRPPDPERRRTFDEGFGTAPRRVLQGAAAFPRGCRLSSAPSAANKRATDVVPSRSIASRARFPSKPMAVSCFTVSRCDTLIGADMIAEKMFWVCAANGFCAWSAWLSVQRASGVSGSDPRRLYSSAHCENAVFAGFRRRGSDL